MNEKTSKRVAAIAGRVSKRLATVRKRYEITEANVVMVKDVQGFWRTIATIDDLEAIAGSCLTQANSRE